MPHKSFIKYSWFLIGMVFLVILAGGVVRMTQSGMGCPDWPKCFGMWIPPVNENQLPSDFEKYLSKQDIDHSFNVYHTWIEYINRLLGALLGVFILGNFIWAVRRYWRSHRSIVAVSFALLILVGFQGWLGKLVVDSNLSVVKITIHMVVAILIAALPLINISILKGGRQDISLSTRWLLFVMLALIATQIVLGTQVREQIDEISKSLSYEQRELWISRLDVMFIIHRSFSWLLLASGLYFWWSTRADGRVHKYAVYTLTTIIITVLLGIVMAYLNMPAIAQPLHLLLACGLAMILIYATIRTKRHVS